MSFEVALVAIESSQTLTVDGLAARKAVQIITGIYSSSKNEGKRILIS